MPCDVVVQILIDMSNFVYSQTAKTVRVKKRLEFLVAYKCVNISSQWPVSRFVRTAASWLIIIIHRLSLIRQLLGSPWHLSCLYTRDCVSKIDGRSTTVVTSRRGQCSALDIVYLWNQEHRYGQPVCAGRCLRSTIMWRIVELDLKRTMIIQSKVVTTLMSEML